MTTIRVESPNAFMKGVAAGIKAADQLDAVTVPTDFDTRLGFFWLLVGQEVSDAGLTSEEDQGLFVQGAKMRAPERRGFLLEFATDGEPFEPADAGDDFDFDERLRSEVAVVLTRVRSAVVDAGVDEGDAVDTRGKVIGRFQLR